MNVHFTIDIMKEACRISKELSDRGYNTPEIALIGAQVQMGATTLITAGFVKLKNKEKDNAKH